MNHNYTPQIDPISVRRTQELNDIIGQKRAVHEEELHKHSLSAVANVHTTLEEAAQAAAIADGVAALTAKADANGKSKKVGLRRGKWTGEEEAYANRLIQEFKRGLLPLTDGTTLRTFLSKLLNCDPMRISKKFVGQNCIGKQVFRRRQSDLDKLTPEQIDKSRRELAELERRFLERVAQTNRSKGGSERAPTPKDSKPSIPSIAEPRNPHIMAQPMYPPAHAHTHMAPWMMPPQQLSAQAPLQSHTHIPYNMSMPSPQPPAYPTHTHTQPNMSDQPTSSASPRTPVQAQESHTSPHIYTHTQPQSLQPPRAVRRKTESDVIVPPSHTVTVSHIHPNTHPNSSKQMGEPSHTYANTPAQHVRKPMTSFPRTPSMELLQSLNLPTVGSLENLASFGMTSFPSSGNLSGFQSAHTPTPMNMMTWEQHMQQVMDHEHTHTPYPNPHPNPNPHFKKHSLEHEGPYPPTKKQTLSEASLPEDTHTHTHTHLQKQTNMQSNSSEFPPPGPFSRMKRDLVPVPTHTHTQNFDIPRNTSVDDFLALIANGDIPPLTNECLSTNSHIRHQTDFPSPTSSPSPPNTHTNTPNTNTSNTHTNNGTGGADMASEDDVHKKLSHTHIHTYTHAQAKGQRGDHVEV